MKTLIIFFLIFFSEHFFLLKNNYEKLDCSTEIILGKSVGDLILGQTTKKQIKVIIGKGEKTRYSDSIWPTHTVIVTKFVYSKIGIELEYSYTSNRGKRLARIVILESCCFKTPEGIGIGSTRKEVERAYGKLKSYYFMQYDSTIYHSIFTDNIEFVLDKGVVALTDTMSYKVKEINMWWIPPTPPH